MLRERFAHRYNRTLFGMHTRNRRGESSRHGDGIESILDRTGGVILRRSLGSKAVEADGTPLVDTDDLKSLVRLLRVVQVLMWCGCKNTYCPPNFMYPDVLLLNFFVATL